MTTEFWAASEITRGRLTSLDDAGDSQVMDVAGYRGESFTKVRRSQPHGFTSHPPAGAVGEFARLGASDRLVALGFETPGRPRNLPAGAVALYNADGTIMKLLPEKVDFDHGGKNSHEHGLARKKIEASGWVHVAAGAVYLGLPPYYPVVTTAGPSQHVFAGILPAAPDAPAGSI